MTASFDDVRAFIRSHQAIFVHFSTYPRMSQRDVWYPDDLCNAIDNNEIFNLCCCCITPEDSLQNYAGRVGIIVAPRRMESITSISVLDGGTSSIEGTNRRLAIADDITVDAMNKTLSERGDRYNEWNICSYDIVGIFTAAPMTVAIKGLVQTESYKDLPDYLADGLNETISERNTCAEEVATVFNAFPVFAFNGSKIYKRIIAEQWDTVNHREIYSWAYDADTAV